MTTAVTLSEFAESVQNLAEEWDDEEPIVVIGDMAADSYNITSKDGYTTMSGVGYSQDLFEGNGVQELSMRVDRRFFGTVLLRPSDLDEEIAEKIKNGELGEESG